MSDTRRRRESEQSGGSSDDLSGSYDKLNVTKDTQSSERTECHHDSEYDTAGGSDVETDAGSQDGGQRESGDGQEEEDKSPKKLDDDEDRRNPQYIPKRGTFYEHDDRTTEEITEGEKVEPPPERETKEKKVWKDKGDRWDHDRYNDDEQAPKSHEELVAVYGYDIRNEEGPPRARRRRRYGRGPNKYTRNWEDEDAYGKPGTNNTPVQKPRRLNKTGEEFPALKGTKDAADTVEEPVISSAWYSNKNKIQNQPQIFPPLPPQQDNQQANIQTNENKAPNEPTNPAWKKDAKYTSQSLNAIGNHVVNDAEKVLYMKQSYSNKRQVQESVSLAASRARGRGFKPGANNNLLTNRTMESKPKGRGGGLITGDNIRRSNTTHNNEEQLSNEMKHMNVNDAAYHHNIGRQNKTFYAQPANQQRSNTTLPRMQPPPPPPHQQQQQHQQQHVSHQQQQQPPQQSPQQQSLPDVVGNRPKRYSTLRQRPVIPEGPVQPAYPQHTQHPQHGQPHAQHAFYPPQGFPQGHFEQPAPVPTSAPTMGGQPVMPLPPAGQPPGYVPPPFLVPPPQFIPAQAAPPSLINYVPGPNGPAFPPNFPGYQSYNPTVPPQGPPAPPLPELFQPQGCTYYSPAQQTQQQQQVAPIRRAKAAIPILPPPDNSQHHQTNRNRGRNVNHVYQSNSLVHTQTQMEHESLNDVTLATTQVPVEAYDNNAISETLHNVPFASEITEQIEEKDAPALIVQENTISVDNEAPTKAVKEAPTEVPNKASIVVPEEAPTEVVKDVTTDIVQEAALLIVVKEEQKDNPPKVVSIIEKVNLPETPEINLSNDIVEIKTKIPVNAVDIDVAIGEIEKSRVDSVVHENPVVEEAAA